MVRMSDPHSASPGDKPSDAVARTATPLGVSVLGATGSIGRSTLDVIARHPDRYRVHALSAQSGVERLFEQVCRFAPRIAVMVDADAADQLAQRLRAAGSDTRVRSGAAALEEIAADPEAPIVMAAIVGAAGLLPALAAARAGKRLLLANKESLVMAGALFTDAVATGGATLLPIDSEHNALFQCLPQTAAGARLAGVERILLTASGGPFRQFSAAQLAQVSPEQAVAHPNWEMGRKISVDSATLMNKGLEVIEARWLFDCAVDRIEVVVHPQSLVHSMVAYRDGSVLAQLGNPDMRTPIAHALAWPQRIESGVAALDICATGRLDFEPPDTARFPCLRLAFEALRAGGDASAVLNAANEVAVAAFLGGGIGFMRIPELIEDALGRVAGGAGDSLDALFAADAAARAAVRERLAAMAGAAGRDAPQRVPAR